MFVKHRVKSRVVEILFVFAKENNSSFVGRCVCGGTVAIIDLNVFDFAISRAVLVSKAMLYLWRFKDLHRNGRSCRSTVVHFLRMHDVALRTSHVNLALFRLQIPVLYQTKWAKGTSPVAAELALAVSGSGEMHKTITAKLNLYDVSLRYTDQRGLVEGDREPLED